MADLKNRLPVVEINTPLITPADTTDQDEDVPALISSADPSAATEPLPAAAPAQVPQAVVAAKEPKPASVPVAAAGSRGPGDRQAGR